MFISQTHLPISFCNLKDVHRRWSCFNKYTSPNIPAESWRIFSHATTFTKVTTKILIGDASSTLQPGLLEIPRGVPLEQHQNPLNTTAPQGFTFMNRMLFCEIDVNAFGRIPGRTSCHPGHVICRDLRIDATASTRFGSSAFSRANHVDGARQAHNVVS